VSGPRLGATEAEVRRDLAAAYRLVALFVVLALAKLMLRQLAKREGR